MFFRKVICCWLLVVIAVGCSDNDRSNSSPQDDNQDTSLSITGSGVKGPLANATVTVYKFDATQADFRSVEPVATGTTNSNAAITELDLPLPLDPPYIMVFTSVPGVTTDVTTGAFPVITTMSTVLTQDLLDKGEEIYSTPLTTMAVDIAVENAADTNGTEGIQADEFEAALTIAASQVVSTLGFGMTSEVDIFDVPPLVDSTTDEEDELADVAAYRAAVEAVTAIAFTIDQQTAEGDTDTVLEAIALDLADGGGIDGSAVGDQINSNTLQVLQQDPASLEIPGAKTNPDTGEPYKVGEIKDLLDDEKADTGSTTDTTVLAVVEVETQPAEIDPDKDNDGVLNADDDFPNDATADKDTDGDGQPDVAYTDETRDTIDTIRSDSDDDNDGWPDGADSDDFPLDATRFLHPERDRDNDGVANGVDNCPLTSNGDQLDTDGNGQGDACSSDADGDGHDDGADNCPITANPSQSDLDNDSIGDVCDSDIDGDGVANDEDQFSNDKDESVDTDKDGIGNNTDQDDDNDGVSDGEDNGTSPVDGSTLCSILRDCDGDGVLDGADFNPLDASVTFNFAPVVNSDSVTVDEDASAFEIDVLANDTDNDGNPADTITLIAVTQQDNPIGTAEIGDGVIVYTPAANVSGEETITYTVSDGTVNSTGALVVTIVSVNDVPAFTSVPPTGVNEDSAYSYTTTVSDNDSSDVLTLSAVTIPSWASFDTSSGVLSGTPTNDDVGNHDVTLRLSDGTETVDQNFTITVTNVNDSPVFTSEAGTDVLEDSAYLYSFAASDVDPGAVLTFTAPTLPAWLNFDNAGTFSGTPGNDDVGVHAVVLRVNDGFVDVDQSFTITVTNVNDAPVISSTAVADATEDSPYSYTLTASDVDANDTLNMSAPTLPSWLGFDSGTGVLSGTPTNDHVGSHSVVLRVNDGTVDVDQSFTITVANVNDAPVLTDDNFNVYPSVATQLDVLANDADVDANDPLTITAVTQGATGVVLVNPSGTAVSYEDTLGGEGSDSFTYTVTDVGGVERTATVSIAVVLDIPPVFSSTPVTTVDEDVLYSYAVSASDGDGHSIALTAPVLPSWMIFTPGTEGVNVTGSLTGTPDNSDVGVHNVTLRATSNGVDVDQEFTITVANVNDAPVFTSTAPTTVIEDNLYEYTATVQDVDVNDVLTLSAPVLPEWLSFDSGTGKLSGIPDPIDVGTHDVTLRVNDGTVDVNDSFTITVNGIGENIAVATLLGPDEGGVVGLESWEDNYDVPVIQFWSDSYNTVDETLEFADFRLNTMIYEFEEELFLSDLYLNNGLWKEEDGFNVVVPDNGDGSMTAASVDVDNTELMRIKLSAQFLDLTGELMTDYLTPLWQSTLIDSNALFTTGAKLVTRYAIEIQNDVYMLTQEDWCDSTTFDALNGNCNNISVPGDGAGGYAEILDEAVVGSAWADPDDGSIPPVFASLEFEDNQQLVVELVSDNTANYFVIDWDSSDPAQKVTELASGTWTRDTSVQLIDMIHYTVPESVLLTFPDFDDGFERFLTVQNGFVRKGIFLQAGHLFFEDGEPLINGLALQQIEANMAEIQYTDAIAGTTLYSIYLEGSGVYKLDSFDFGLDGGFTITNDDGSVDSGTWQVTPEGLLHITLTAPAFEEWWIKLKSIDPETGIREACAAASDAGPFDCTVLDFGTAFEYQLIDHYEALFLTGDLNTDQAEITVPLFNPDGSRDVAKGLFGEPLTADELITGSHELEFPDGEVAEVTFDVGGTGTMVFSTGTHNITSWIIDDNGVLRMTETAPDDSEVMWSIGLFAPYGPGNLLMHNVTDDHFFIAGLNVTLLAFDGETLPGTSHYNVFYCPSADYGCTVGNWETERLDFDADGTTLTVTIINGDGSEGEAFSGTYEVRNGVLDVTFDGGTDTVVLFSEDGSGVLYACRASENQESSCPSGYAELIFVNLTDAQTFQTAMSFAGTPADAATLLAGDGIYEYFQEEFASGELEVGFWNLSYNDPDVVDVDMIWTSALQRFVPVRLGSDIILTASGWEWVSEAIAAVTTNGSDAALDILAADDSVIETYDVSFSAMDIGGETMAHFLPIGTVSESAAFSTGASWLKVTGTNTNGITKIDFWDDCDDPNAFGGNCNTVNQRTITGNEVSVTIAIAGDLSFIDDTTQTVELGYSNDTSLLGIFNGGVVSYWTVNWSSGTTAVDTGITSPYTLSSDVNGVAGLDILEYEVPANIPDYDSFNLFYDAEEGEVGIMSVHEATLRHGSSEASGTQIEVMAFDSVAYDDIVNNETLADGPMQDVFGTWVLHKGNLEYTSDVLTFLADGSYMQSGSCDDANLPAPVSGSLLGSEPGITGAAPEIGGYNWSLSTTEFTVVPVIDANASCGLHDDSIGFNSGTMSVSGDVLTIDSGGVVEFNRVVETAVPIVGSWLMGDTDSLVVLTFFENGYYTEAQSCLDHQLEDGTPADISGGMEYGTYNWDSGTGAITGDVLVDTDGWCGLHDSNDANTAIGVSEAITAFVEGDVMTLQLGVEEEAVFYRIQ